MVVSVDASVPRISEELRQRLLEVDGMQVLPLSPPIFSVSPFDEACAPVLSL